jgi:aminopeptidase S
MEPTLDPAAVARRIDAAAIERHLAALWQATRAHDGHRGSGSAGYEAAQTYATSVLEAAGYEVERLPFGRDGVSGTNLIVERPGAGETGEVVMLGAHLDSVPGSPGMNDDGSGVAAVVAVAEAIGALPPPHHTIRLALWDAEEHGPFGSAAYVDALRPAERARIRAYLNLDMIGSPNGLRLVYAEADAAPGSDAISDALAGVLDDAGLAWERIDLDGDSDHGPFVAAGIPTGGLFSGGVEPVTDAQARRFGAVAGVPADACSHRPCDTIDNVDPALAAELARSAAIVLVELASAGR